MNALKAVDVCHAYGKGKTVCEVLRGFSLTLAPGEFVALMGPSGSGKSTFLHLAAGLLSPTSGTIEVAGVSVSSLGDSAAARFRRRHEGIVFQSFNLLENLSVADNITLSAKLDHARLDRARLDELVQKLGLDGKAARHPSELSGGEQQRVALARALYRKPAVVLADEPTGNLDARATHTTCSLLKELNATEQSAILLVTHDPVVASAATRVCFLSEGKIAHEMPTGNDPSAISASYLEICR